MALAGRPTDAVGATTCQERRERRSHGRPNPLMGDLLGYGTNNTQNYNYEDNYRQVLIGHSKRKKFIRNDENAANKPQQD